MPTVRTKHLWKWMSRYIRAKYSHDGFSVCMTCGCVKHPKELQAGHVFPKGSSRYRSIEFNEMNVYPQCGACNKWKMNFPEYKERAEAHARSIYGDKAIDNMLALSRTATSKMTGFEINLKMEMYKKLFYEICEWKNIEIW